MCSRKRPSVEAVFLTVLSAVKDASGRTGARRGCLFYICDKEVVDTTDEEDGDDAVFCEGECQSWLHRNCACLPKSEFERLKKEDPFYCPRCSSHAGEYNMHGVQ